LAREDAKNREDLGGLQRSLDPYKLDSLWPLLFTGVLKSPCLLEFGVSQGSTAIRDGDITNEVSVRLGGERNPATTSPNHGHPHLEQRVGGIMNATLVALLTNIEVTTNHALEARPSDRGDSATITGDVAVSGQLIKHFSFLLWLILNIFMLLDGFANNP
jgi:hypothetical protein